MSKTISIDLGTSNSVVCANVGGVRTVIPNDLGSSTTPSAVAFKKDGERLVGQVAKRQQITNHQNTFTSFKRLMGHTFEEVKDEKSSYKIKANDKGLAVVESPLLNKDFTPEELSGFVLGYLKKCAEDYLGESVTDAIITVPAYFNQDQRIATQNAGKLCGLNVLRTINEPTAAALAYGSNTNTDGLVLVYDLGGGTFDVTLLEVSSDDDFYHVLASSGDSRLGGDDFDQKIMDWIIKEFKKDNGVDLSKDSAALQRIRDAAEKAKCELSSQVTTNINIPFITSVDNQPVHLSLDLTRNKFESLITDLLERIKGPVKEVIGTTDKSKIKEILLVGGSTRVPCVVKLIEDMIGIPASKGVNPDLAVAEGACELAKTLEGSGSIVLADVTSLSFGIETKGDLYHILVPKNSTIPTSKKEIFTTASNNQDAVDVVIYTGERPMAKDNKMLGTFKLSGIPPAPAGIPQIEIELKINASGVLDVSAKELSTGTTQSITITGSSNLSPEEIDRMIKDAEMYEKADNDLKELVIAKNNFESLIGGANRVLADYKDIDSQDKESLEKIIEESNAVLRDAKDKQEITDAEGKLNSILHPITQKMYQSQSSNTAEPSDPEVVDAEIVE